MPTPNLAVPYVAANQNQKEVTINAGFDQLDNASNSTLAVDCTNGGTITITAAQYTKNGMIRLQGTPGAGYAVKVPNTKRALIFSNESGQSASIQSTGGGTATGLPDASRGLFFNQGTDLVPVIIVGSGGGGVLSADTDVSFLSLADNDAMVFDFSVLKWKNRRPRYIVGASITTGVLTNGQILLYHPVTKDVTFPANFGAYLGHSSRAGGDANATASTVITVDTATSGTGSWTNIGSITIGAGGVAATFATVSGTAKTVAAGSVIRIKGPLVADATFANFFAALVGFEA